VHFARFDFEVQTFEDFAIRQAGVEVGDFETHVWKKGELSFFGDTGRADTVDSHVRPGDPGTCGKLPKQTRVEVCLRMRIGHLTALVTVEMNMLVKIGAVAGLGSLHIDLLDESTRRQVLKAVVNGCQ
jgi:hypothetical protein